MKRRNFNCKQLQAVLLKRKFNYLNQISDTGLVSESENRIQKTKFREETRTLKI